jgi:oligoendopeptidase F
VGKDTQRTAESWNIRDIYDDEDSFARERSALEARLPELDRWKGRLGSSAATLAEALDEIDDVYRIFLKLRSYASLRSDQDTRVAALRAVRQQVGLLGTEISSRLSFLRPEILTIPPETIEGFLRDEPSLAPHAFFLRDLNRQRAHVLTPPEERIMAESGLATQSAPSLYGVLNDAELPRPRVRLDDGTRVRLVPVEFHRHRSSPHRPDRLKVFRSFFRAYKKFNETLGLNLYSATKSHLFRARARGYESCLAAALDRDNVPVAVYHNLLARVRDHLPVLHRYLRLRARALELARLEYADLHCPLTEAPATRYSTVESRELLAQSLEPLGAVYVAALERAFAERWIDWHPAPGKRSGAYANGWVYDAHPYVLLNYTESYEGLSTLAHEMGHALHSHFSNRAQPFATADYSIFVAEVASTLNEALLADRMIETARSDAERLFLLASHLDGLRGTLFRQTMFAEFELEIHERVERGEALTGEGLNERYLETLRFHHGHDRKVMRIAGDYAVEWAAIPHFYYDFYVYQYATGVVAATALAEKILAGEPGAASRYNAFLASGGSDYPLALLRRAGVDLESAEPYETAFSAMTRHLDRLEALLDARDPRGRTG